MEEGTGSYGEEEKKWSLLYRGGKCSGAPFSFDLRFWAERELYFSSLKSISSGISSILVLIFINNTISSSLLNSGSYHSLYFFIRDKLIRERNDV